MSSAEGIVVKALLKIVAFLPVYTAIITTLTLLAIIFGFPFMDGG